MEIHQLILIGLAAAVVAGADLFIRLRLAPSRRDGWVEQLFAPLGFAEQAGPRLEGEQPVAQALLRHFEQSYASREIVKVLAEAPRGITGEELEERFAERAARAGKSSPPRSALHKVVGILMGSNFVRSSGGRFLMTHEGWALHTLLQGRRKA